MHRRNWQLDTKRRFIKRNKEVHRTIKKVNNAVIIMLYDFYVHSFVK